MANFVKNGHFLGSGMTYDRVLFVLRSFLTPKKWKMVVFNKVGHKKFKFLFLGQNFDMPKFFEFQSILVKSGQKFQLEPR